MASLSLGDKLSDIFTEHTTDLGDPDDRLDDTSAKLDDHDLGVQVDVHTSKIRGIDANLGAKYSGKVVSRAQLQSMQQSESDPFETIGDDSDMNDMYDMYDFDGDKSDEEEEEEEDSDLNENDIRHRNGMEMEHFSDEEMDTLNEDKDYKSAGFDAMTMPGEKFTKRSKYLKSNYVRNGVNNINDVNNDVKFVQARQQRKMETFAKDDEYDSHQVRKSRAVATQCKFYDKVASLRIHMQAPLQIAQKLPRPSVYRALLQSDGTKAGDDTNESASENNTHRAELVAKINNLFGGIQTESMKLTKNMMHLQDAMFAKNPNLPPPLRNKLDRKRMNASNSSSDETEYDMEEVFKELQEDFNAFLPYCNQILDSWDEKMKLVDTHTFNKKKHGMVQTLSDRINSVAESPQKVLQKMQSVDKYFRMFGDSVVVMNEMNEMNDETIGLDGKLNRKLNTKKIDERILAGLEDDAQSLKYERYRIENEVFNDSQFHRRMLKELIDIGQSAQHVQSVESVESVAQDEIEGDLANRSKMLFSKFEEIQNEKKRQKMEYHKARMKMKYTVRPDMENFMAPRFTHDPDFQVRQLYNSLFQRT